MENNYYLYYRCDRWKMRTSFELVGIFGESKLKQIIIEDINNKDIEFDNRNVEEIAGMEEQEINNSITYGYLEKVFFNERMI
jgi:hypothetical protein